MCICLPACVLECMYVWMDGWMYLPYMYMRVCYMYDYMYTCLSTYVPVDFFLCQLNKFERLSWDFVKLFSDYFRRRDIF